VMALELSGDIDTRRSRYPRAIKHYEEALRLKVSRGVRRRILKKLQRLKRLK